MTEEESPPNLLKKALQFFRDETIPMGARVGVAGGIALVLTFPLWANLGSSKRTNPVISEINFPSGPSGLAEADPEADLARAQANQLLESQKEQVKQKTEKTKQMLAAVDPAEDEAMNAIDEDVVDQSASEPDQSKSVNPEARQLDLPAPKKVNEKPKEQSQAIAPQKNAGAFRMLPIPIRVSRGIFEGADQTIYLSYRKGILSFKNGKLGNAKTILSNKTYDAEYNTDLPELSNIGVGSDGSLYAGFEDGQLMRYQGYEWKILATGTRGTQSKIYSIVSADQNLFVGAKGLYQWDDSLKQFFSNPTHRGARVRSIAKSPSGKVYMSSRRAVWRYMNDDEDSWEPIWRAPKSDRSINYISMSNEDSFALGTVNGLVRVSVNGVVLDRALENENVQSIIEKKDGSMWVGTRGAGLRYFDGLRWYSAKEEQGFGNWVTELLLDSRGRLWASSTGVGVFIANEKSAVEWIKKFPDQTSEATEPQIFSDACEAADSLLKDVALSNQIANRPFDGRGYVFLNGVQTCPKGVGRYRADGTAVLLKGWNALVFKDNKRIERVIPKEVPADRAQIIFLDSSDRIWISIKDGELFASTKEGFEKIAIPALQNNPVTSITEDLRGALWFGSTPSFDQKAETYHQKNLHMFKEGAWQHFDSRDGLIQNSTLSMARSDKSGLAIGTRSGISFINLDGKVTNYGEEQGLDPRHIASVNIDGRNQVWFSHLFHGDGIGWISKGIINRFTSKQGLFNPKIGNIALDRYGKVWVEASNGKIGVYPLSYLKDNAISFQIPPKTIREIGLGEPRNN